MKRYILLILSAFLLGACNQPVNDNDIIISTSEESSSSHDSSSSSSGSSSISSSESSSSESSSSSEEDPVIDLGKKSIAQVKALCAEHVTELNEGNIGINTGYKVTIEATAFDHIDLVKTKSYCGVSTPKKTFFADNSGYIACAGNDLFSAASSYTSKQNSVYTVTGNLSIYMGMPEIYVTSYQYESSKTPSFDHFANAKEKNLTLGALYIKLQNMPYNMAGHGYGDIYTLNNFKILYKAETNCYVGSDGYNLIKVICYENKIYEGSIYNIAGMISTVSWMPAIRVLSATKVTDETIINSFPSDYKNAMPLTITNLKKNVSSTEDTDTRMNNFIDSFKNLYKATVYASYYDKSSKLYTTLSDSYYTGGTVPSETSAHNTYGMVELENLTDWAVTEDKLFQYSPLAPYINEEQTVEVYYCLWQTRQLSGKLCWKVFYFSDMLPEISTGE